MSTMPPVGAMLRNWRERRRLSQLEFAGAAGISTRHLSFVETGRSLPSRAMLLRLVERLEVPLRERNALLVAAGLAPMYSERRLDDPAMQQARAAIDLVLAGHEPYPALCVDRHWTLIAHNRAVAPFLGGVTPALTQPPVNVLRLSLHPDGLAPRIANWGEWRAHVLARLQHQHAATLDPVLAALVEELAAYPAPAGVSAVAPVDASTVAPFAASVVVPLRLRDEHGALSFISTTTVFGTPLDVTLAELAIESFFPADAATAAALRGALPPA
jgi:transcriptional regulator with XRE-family HTH domain